MISPLKKCKDCGIEAWNESELYIFHKVTGRSYDRGNWCKSCREKYMRNYSRKNHEGLIKCEICGIMLHRITGMHLKSYDCQLSQSKKMIEVLNSTQYKKMFPNAILMSNHMFSILSNAGNIGGKITAKRYPELKKQSGKRLSEWYLNHTPREKILAWGRKYAKKGGAIGGKTYWNNITPTELEKRRIVWNELFRKYWDNLTEEEKSSHGRRGGVAALKKLYKPNNQEKMILSIIQELGYTFNKKAFRIDGYSDILKRVRTMVPDYVHIKFPILIEYDGNGGHDPTKPWVPSNQPLLDNERDRIYKEKGYEIIRITYNDLIEGKEHIKNIVENVTKLFF